MPRDWVKELAARFIIEHNGIEMRDVDGGEEAFLYSSGNRGPGYVSVKGLVGRAGPVPVLKTLAAHLAVEIADQTQQIDFVIANATGGMIPGWILAEVLTLLYGRTIPCVYMRGSRKAGGQKELFTGLESNPGIPAGSVGVVVEELVNFAQTTTNSALAAREMGFEVNRAGTILNYDNPEARKLLKKTGVDLVDILTLSELLDFYESSKPGNESRLAQYRNFLADPLGWQRARGFSKKEEGGTL